MSEPKGVFEAIACGSYRRGKPDCGDLDILVTRRDGKTTKDFLVHLIQK
jgi:DNA polymerase lambda